MKQVKALILALSMVLSVFATSMVVEAAPAEMVNYLNESAPGGTGGATKWGSSKVKGYFSERPTATYAEAVTYGPNGAEVLYYDITKEETILAQIRKANDASTADDKVSDITGGLDLSADTETATQILSGFLPIVSTGLGIMVVLITVGMTIFSAFDLCYIAFPVFRNGCEGQKSAGEGPMVKSEKDGSLSIRFVSTEAQYAVTKATIENGENPYKLYFGKRVASYLILSVLLFILLTGNISILTDLALRVASGILNLIGDLV